MLPLHDGIDRVVTRPLRGHSKMAPVIFVWDLSTHRRILQDYDLIFEPLNMII